MAARSTTLTIRVPAELRNRLGRLARATARSNSWLAQEALRTYVELNEWQTREIEDGLADAVAGRTVDHEDVKAWLESWGTAKEKRGHSSR